jgi:hypothetical protein
MTAVHGLLLAKIVSTHMHHVHHSLDEFVNRETVTTRVRLYHQSRPMKIVYGSHCFPSSGNNLTANKSTI